MEYQTGEMDVFWEAIQTRNRDWDGRLFFGVKTTGIYCRPSCPAKRPLRSSILCFSSAQEAEMAGFRPCKRCHPNLVETLDQEFQRIIGLLDKPDNEALSVQDWASQAKIPAERLRRIILDQTGMSPKKVLLQKKMKVFKQGLKAGETISASQNSAGFGSSSRLYEKAELFLGMTPGLYKRGGDGVNIRYEVINTPIGKLLIAGTTKGVCSIQFGESEAELVGVLRKEYPKAEIELQAGELSGWINQLENYFSGLTHTLTIPLDHAATAFQLRVWQELRNIPYGETRSYSQVAEAIGQPTAARAVAAACAANPAAVVTPCHRVVHSDGSISGYRWGAEKKLGLLETEKNNAAKSLGM
jgi:AraC family transcriptional regulator, regulatory protein of adaptative response / methylated-DNA-[protein]-cysteine methyltransferase